MPGYEELTPDQIMTIAWMMYTGLIIIVIGWAIRAALNFMTARVIQFRIEKEVATNIADRIALKKSWIQQIKIWWSKRKEKEPDPFEKYIIKPIEEK